MDTIDSYSTVPTSPEQNREKTTRGRSGGNCIVCVYLCAHKCASSSLSMSVNMCVCQDTKAVSMSVIANVCILCVIRGMEEGVEGRTQSRDSERRRRRMWGGCSGMRKRPVRWWASGEVCLWSAWVDCGLCGCVFGGCEEEMDGQREKGGVSKHLVLLSV